MSTADEREAYQGDAQDFRHKQSLRTDAARCEEVRQMVRGHTAGCRCELCYRLPPFQEHAE